MLWSWGVPSSGNEGVEQSSDIGVTSADGRRGIRIGPGDEAAFSPDGRNVFWLRPEHADYWDGGHHHRPRDLCGRSISGGPVRVIAKDVEAFGAR